MKILWTSVPGGGGVAPQGRLIVKKLQERGHEVITMNLPPLKIGYPEPFLATEVDGIKHIFPVKNLLKAIEKIDPEIIVLHTLNPDLADNIGKIRQKYPVVIRVGINLLELISLDTYRHEVNKVISLLTNVDHVICAGPNTIGVMKSIGIPEKKLTYIPTVVDTTKLKPTMCRDPTILMMGRIATVKNHLTVLEAFKLVKQEIPEAELAITGRGAEYKEVLQRVIKQLNLSDCQFVGYITDLNYLFNEVSILVHPSITENLPQAVIEAYATGTPCVLSDCGWSKIFEAPLKAPHDDPQALSRQIIKLLSDEKLWNDVREAQLKELEEKFNIEDALDKYEEVLESIPSAWGEWLNKPRPTPQEEPEYKALFIVDVPNWAWDIASKELLQNLPEVQGEIINLQQQIDSINTEHYDAIFVYPWAREDILKLLDPEKTVICIAGGEQLSQLRSQFEKNCERFKFYGACNREIQKILKQRYPDKTSLLLSHGVDTNLFKPPHVEPEDFEVCWVGNAGRKSKRYNLARKIVEEAGLKLNVAGYQGDLAVKPGRIRIRSIPHEKMPEFYNSNGCLLVTSEYEAHPLVVYEAMSSGLSVVATKVGDVAEYITHGENGFLLDVDAKPEEFIEILTMLKEDPALRKSIGKAARNTVLRKLKWSNVADQYRAALKLIKEVRK